jgi:hypothetical protein
MIGMSKKVNIALTLSLSILCFGVAHASNEELAAAVKESIQQEWSRDPELRLVTVKELTLIQGGDKNYRGLLETSSFDNEEKSLMIVTTDDDNIIWEISE